jgi:hypothetical protein
MERIAHVPARLKPQVAQLPGGSVGCGAGGSSGGGAAGRTDCREVHHRLSDENISTCADYTARVAAQVLLSTVD